MKILISFCLLFFISQTKMTYKEAFHGTKAPDSVKKQIKVLDLNYYGFDGKIHKGQLLVNTDLQADTKEIFDFMLKNKFPIEKMIPVSAYDWSDDASMKDNNTSAFNYRFVAGTKRLSNHSYGRAIDINPRINPVFYNDGRMSPENGERDTTKAGTFYKNHPVVLKFKELGWEWGGDWNSLKDYHHFQKK